MPATGLAVLISRAKEEEELQFEEKVLYHAQRAVPVISNDIRNRQEHRL
jgi:hypothetical protein